MCPPPPPPPPLPPGPPPFRRGGNGHGHGRTRSPEFRPLRPGRLLSLKAGEVAAPGAPAAGREGLEPGCPGSRSVPGSGRFPVGIHRSPRQERHDLRCPRLELAAADGQEERTCSSLRCMDGAAAE
ncbi:putative cuticle collagen 155 [Vidua chalybeata]|uniref:putative cuticle collagen 155 n=1 Tax=Vidua chalybeata TaxID=81927 RepID=UPI0023A8A2B2|nr:putative cuticle collagen 155 [Vidua chalybeata]